MLQAGSYCPAWRVGIGAGRAGRVSPLACKRLRPRRGSRRSRCKREEEQGVRGCTRVTCDLTCGRMNALLGRVRVCLGAWSGRSTDPGRCRTSGFTASGSERKRVRGLTEIGENGRTGKSDVAATDNEDLSGAKSPVIEAYEGERPELGAHKTVNVFVRDFCFGRAIEPPQPATKFAMV